MLTISLCIAICLDLLIGDPFWLPHPIRWIGSLISHFERLLYPEKRSHQKEFISGILLCILVLGITGGSVLIVNQLCILISPYANFVLQTIVAFYCLSVKSLAAEARKILYFLTKNDLPSARKAVSMIVGRDTENLDEQDIARATIETVAENITDGIVSPLLYLAIGGPVAGLVFKAVSTMDSMIGYKNNRYRHFGTCAAWFDDVLNFIPARITSFLILPLVALLMGKNVRKVIRIVVQDRLKHPSPNSAHSEAAFAGLLGICLGGEATYNGNVSIKPQLNSEGREPIPNDIRCTIRVLYYASVMSSIIALSLNYLIVKINIII